MIKSNHSGKLYRNWIGPYLILKIIRPDKLLLQCLNTTKEIVVHKDNVKLAHAPVESIQEFAFENSQIWGNDVTSQTRIIPKRVSFSEKVLILPCNIDSTSRDIGKYKQRTSTIPFPKTTQLLGRNRSSTNFITLASGAKLFNSDINTGTNNSRTSGKSLQ